jgi:hypothetical protein
LYSLHFLRVTVSVRRVAGKWRSHEPCFARYRVFSCLGCIDDGTAHVRIEKQIVVMVPVVPTVDPNPFKTQPEVNPFTGRAKT